MYEENETHYYGSSTSEPASSGENSASKASGKSGTTASRSRKVAKLPAKEKVAFEELLIDFVKSKKQLWHSGEDGYKEKTKTDENFALFIKENHLNLSVAEVKQSWQSLRCVFNQKRKKMRDKR